MTDAHDNRPPEPLSRDERAVHLLQAIFHGPFCELDEIPPGRKHQVLARHFFRWLDANMMTLDQDALMAEAKVDAEIWYFVRQLAENPAAVEMTAALWPCVVLRGRPKSPAPVASVNVVCNITFADGTISTTQGFASADMLTPGQAAALADDDVVVPIALNNLKAVGDAVMEAGLARLHAQAQVNVFGSPEPEDPYDVLMGFLLKLVRGEPLPAGAALKPALRRPAETYLALIRQMVRPLVPAHVMAGFRQRQAAAAAAEKGEVRGGWNL